MLSILIPTYNYDVTKLVTTLNKQAEKQHIDFEIIVMDDASDDACKEINRELNNLPAVKYIELKQNLGRAKIRNELAKVAKYKHLLYLDCDSRIKTKDFIKRYLAFCNEETVVYGGRIYSKKTPKEKEYMLHWRYGTRREVVAAPDRSRNSNQSFQTNNFLIAKSIVSAIPFNEGIKDYGHEDTLFGYELAKQQILIRHIDNPVIHMGIERNTEFLEKTREGIANLKYIIGQNGTEKKLIKDIKILQYYKFFRDFKLKGLVGKAFHLLEPVLFRNLTGKKPNLLLFDLYKLGYLCSLN